MKISELLKRKEYLHGNLIKLQDDIRQYISVPSPSVDIQQITYQYEFDLKEMKKIKNAITNYLTTEYNNSHQSFEILQKQLYQCDNEIQAYLKMVNKRILQNAL